MRFAHNLQLVAGRISIRWKHFHSLQQWQSVCASFCMDFRIQIVIYIGYHPMLLIFDRTSHNIIADCHV